MDTLAYSALYTEVNNNIHLKHGISLEKDNTDMRQNCLKIIQGKITAKKHSMIYKQLPRSINQSDN